MININCPVWVVVTIIWLCLSGILAWKAEQSHGMFGGMDEAMGCMALLACYVVFMVTYFAMR